MQGGVLMDASETKQALFDFIHDLDDTEAEKLWQYITDNFEVVKTDYDKEQIIRANQELAEGKFRFI